MNEINMMNMLKAGVHFGHQKAKRHPKMEPFVYAIRNNVSIIDLRQSLEKLEEAKEFAKKITGRKGTILFVGTKKQTKEIVKEAAEKCGMPCVTERWLGGTLTNFKIILKRVEKFKRMVDEKESGEWKDKYTKKEQVEFSKDIKRMELKFGGIKNLNKLPEALFVADPKENEAAVKEANAMSIPVIAIADTDVDPSEIDYPIPANDDAIQAIKMMVGAIREAIIESKNKD